MDPSSGPDSGDLGASQMAGWEAAPPLISRLYGSEDKSVLRQSQCQIARQSGVPAPFFDPKGKVIGAVVTSEELDFAVSAEALTEPPRRRIS